MNADINVINTHLSIQFYFLLLLFSAPFFSILGLMIQDEQDRHTASLTLKDLNKCTLPPPVVDFRLLVAPLYIIQATSGK